MPAEDQGARDRADEAEKHCARDNAAAEEARKEAEDYRSEQQRLLRREQEEIDMLAEQKISALKAQLKSSKEKELSILRSKHKEADEKYRRFYKAKYEEHEFRYYLIFCFCLLWLIILAVTSNNLRQDFLEAGSRVTDYFMLTGPKIEEVSISAASISEQISNEDVSNAIYWLVRILVTILLGEPPVNLILLWLIIQVIVPVVRGILALAVHKISGKYY